MPSSSKGCPNTMFQKASSGSPLQSSRAASTPSSTAQANCHPTKGAARSRAITTIFRSPFVIAA
jgi:hypothetical protein